MDVLQNIIKSLEKEEIKSYKLYSKRTHDFNNRIDIELFNSIKSNPEWNDAQHFKLIYKAEKSDSRYYRLKNKISEDIGVVLSNLNRNEKDIEALHLLIIAKIFFKKNQAQLAQHYLRLSEKKAIAYEDYTTLEIIYELFIQLSLQNIKESPETYIKKREENSNRLGLLRELENNFSLLSYKLKTTQNLAITKSFKVWMHTTLEKTQGLDYVKNSATLRFKVFQNICRLLLLSQDYNALENYLIKSNAGFEKDHLFNKETHEIKIQLYIYQCNASYVLKKYRQALLYAKQLQQALQEYNKLWYEKYIFYYYNILVNNYSKTTPEKAIETLEEARKQSVIKETPNYMGFVLLNLAITHFDMHHYKLAGKHLVQLYVSDAFKNYDEAFRLKISVFELCNKVDSGEIELAEKLAFSISKKLAELKNKETLSVEIAVLQLVQYYISKTFPSWRQMKDRINTFTKKFSDVKEQETIINYTEWLTAKL
ncbi:MAG: hypothetical protein V4506_06830 [Bacteroidota bacterium]